MASTERTLHHYELLSTFNQKASVFTVLGVPVAGDTTSFLKEMVDQAGESIQLLVRLKHKQGELIIFRSAGPFTRISHLLRAIAPESWPIELLQNIDGFTLNEIERLLGTPMSEIARKQALSPVSFGGLGLHFAMDNTRHQFLYDKGLESIGQQLCNLRGLEAIPKPPVPTKIQPSNRAKTKLQALLRTASEGDRTLLAQTIDPHSGAFLTAKPVGCTELKEEAFTTTLRLRLGLEQLPSGCRCLTHQCLYDARGHHALSCQNFQRSVHIRHDMIRDEIFSFCKCLDDIAEHGIEHMELAAPDDLSQFNGGDPATEQHASGRTIPGDISLRLSRDDASRTFYDVTVVNTLTAQAIFTAEKAATPTEGFLLVLRAAFDRKVAKHGADVSCIGGRFVPFVVSTTGVWYPDSLRELRKIATYVSTLRGNSDSDSWKLLLAKVGCAMARGNELVLASARRALTAAAEGVDE